MNIKDKAIKILKTNSYDKFTVPNKKLYPFQWNWDSLVSALGISTYDLDRSILEIETLFESQWDNGMIPHIIFHQKNDDYFPGESEWTSNTSIPTSCITQPPISGSILYYLFNNYKSTINLKKIKELFNKILKNMLWFEEYRDMDNLGCISIIHPWESGRDNSIEWDKALKNVKVSENLKKYSRKDLRQISNEERPTKEDYDKYITIVDFGEKCKWNKHSMFYDSPFNVIDIGIQFMYIKSLKDLLLINNELNLNQGIELQRMIKKYEKGCNMLWNNKIKCYSSFDLRENKLIDEITHASFLCYYAEIFNKNYDHYILNNYKSFVESSNFSVPSISINHLKFDSKKYWRGPIWCIINLFLLIGFQKIDKEISDKISKDTINLIENVGFYEYYNPIISDGYGCVNFSWTAAIYLVLVNKYQF